MTWRVLKKISASGGLGDTLTVVRPFFRTGLWAGDTPLRSPDLPFIRFCVLIVDVVLELEVNVGWCGPSPEMGHCQEDAFRGILDWISCVSLLLVSTFLGSGGMNDKKCQGSTVPVCKDRRLQ